jgi:hypothetical protein
VLAAEEADVGAEDELWVVGDDVVMGWLGAMPIID